MNILHIQTYSLLDMVFIGIILVFFLLMLLVVCTALRWAYLTLFVPNLTDEDKRQIIKELQDQLNEQ